MKHKSSVSQILILIMFRFRAARVKSNLIVFVNQHRAYIYTAAAMLAEFVSIDKCGMESSVKVIAIIAICQIAVDSTVR